MPTAVESAPKGILEEDHRAHESGPKAAGVSQEPSSVPKGMARGHQKEGPVIPKSTNGPPGVVEGDDPSF